MDNIQDALSIFNEAVAAVKPSTLIRKYVSWKNGTLFIHGEPVNLQPGSRIMVTGAGKASALMAKEVEEVLGRHIANGVVVTKHEHFLPLKAIQLLEAGHPVPDAHSLNATRQLLDMLKALQPDDVVIFLLSGGASSLLADCPEGINLQEVQETYSLLLRCGAGIHAINTVRKHLSGVKGGQLARHIYPARLYSLILSDVIGDDLDVIGSGPTVPDQSTFQEAYQVLEKYGIVEKIPASVIRHIRKGLTGAIPDTPKADAACFKNVHNYIIGNNTLALQAAAAQAEALGYHQQIVTHTLEGEARELGKTIAEKALSYKGALPACFLFGGESTVTIKGKGKGGRNQELALAAGIALLSADRSRNLEATRKDSLENFPQITVLSAGTDGTDGLTDAAGAVVDVKSMKWAVENQLNPVTFLDANDSYHFFSEMGGLVKTGPTQTNVMDIILILIK